VSTIVVDAGRTRRPSTALAGAEPARLSAILTPLFDELVSGRRAATPRRRPSGKTG